MADEMTGRGRGSMVGAAAVLAAVCGLLYPLLLMVGDDLIGAVAGEAPGRGSSAVEAAAWAAESDETAFYVGRFVGGGLALLALLVFVSYVARRIRDWDPGWLPTAALVAGTLAVGMQMTGVVVHFTAVRWAGELDPAVTAAIAVDLMQVWSLAFLPMALFIAIASLAALRGDIMARWTGWLGLVVAAGLVAGELAQAASDSEVGVAFVPVILAWIVWFPATSISLALRARAESASASPTAAPAGA